MLCDLPKAFEKVQLIAVWNWTWYFAFKMLLLCLRCGYFAHQRRVVFEGGAAAPVEAPHSNIP